MMRDEQNRTEHYCSYDDKKGSKTSKLKIHIRYVYKCLRHCCITFGLSILKCCGNNDETRGPFSGIDKLNLQVSNDVVTDISLTNFPISVALTRMWENKSNITAVITTTFGFCLAGQFFRSYSRLSWFAKASKVARFRELLEQEFARRMPFHHPNNCVKALTCKIWQEKWKIVIITRSAAVIFQSR